MDAAFERGQAKAIGYGHDGMPKAKTVMAIVMVWVVAMGWAMAMAMGRA